jgi:glyceraldehyde 3-phosphate dehydrogenase
LVKIIGWYDNEMGYSARLADLILRIFWINSSPKYSVAKS